VKKARFLYLHPDVNVGKIAALDALQAKYAAYLDVCVATMLDARRFKVALREKQDFFPECSELSSQIVKNVRDHAIGMVSGWAASKYTVKLRAYIKRLYHDRCIDERTRSALCILGKRLVDAPSGKVTQDDLDLYWSWLLDPDVVGRTPTVSSRCGMRMSEMTAVLDQSEETALTPWWLGFSHLDAGKRRIQVPLTSNPYVSQTSQVSKGVLARKDKRGRWRFEVVEKAEWLVPEPDEDEPRIAIDVGLNCMVATSTGMLLGTSMKPKFDRLYRKARDLRANRQRQGLKDNSPKLDRLEAKLSGMIKTMAGECTNKLVAWYPGHMFVHEDLDLRGCRGQKRFAYRAVHHALASKTQTMAVNPAYTSQSCPSCGYVSRNNRSGTKFKCRSCGRLAHADAVGGKNLLGRSEDNQVLACDDVSEVRSVLRERWRQRRNSSLGLRPALEPSSPDPYCGGTSNGRRTGSNLGPTQSACSFL